MRILLAFTCILFFACHPSAQITPNIQAPATLPSKPSPPVTWDKKTIDLGTVTRGEKRDMFFEFTNVSGQDLKIEIVDACECTTTDFPRGMIAPGQKGKITAQFDSKDKTAAETIDIRIIFANTDPAGNPLVETVKYSFDLKL